MHQRHSNETLSIIPTLYRSNEIIIYQTSHSRHSPTDGRDALVVSPIWHRSQGSQRKRHGQRRDAPRRADPKRA